MRATIAWLLGRGDWLQDGAILACSYPRTGLALGSLRRQGVRLVVNLHPRPHDPGVLARYGMTQLHLPVPDFTPPSAEQLDTGVAAIVTSVERGEPVAVHCGAGLGRTGTLLACYLVSRGMDAGEAIARVRAVRPGAIETTAQAAAVRAYRPSLRDRSVGLVPVRP